MAFVPHVTVLKRILTDIQFVNAYKLKRVYATYVQSIVNRDIVIVGYEVR